MRRIVAVAVCNNKQQIVFEKVSKHIGIRVQVEHVYLRIWMMFKKYETESENESPPFRICVILIQNKSMRIH